MLCCDNRAADVLVASLQPRSQGFSFFKGKALGTRLVSLGLIGNLSKDVFERRTSTGSEAFSLLICLDANKFVLLSFFSLIKTIYPRVSTDPLPNDAKSPFPVDVRRSKTLLLKFPNFLVLLTFARIACLLQL